MRRAAALLLLPVLYGFTCGHSEKEGPYNFVVDQIIQDRCGLIATPGTVATGTLQVIGDNAQFADFTYQGVTLQMVGPFLSESDSFQVDGTAGNLSLPVGGQPCSVDLLQIDVTATTDGGLTSFSGNMRIDYQSQYQTACQCQATLTYNAALQ